VKRTSFDGHPCSIAQALDVVGEWWTLLIVRDVAYGLSRFGELQEDLGVSANVLSDRLATLVEAGVLATRPYQTAPERREYVLTEKGRELIPVLVALKRWGDRWGWEDGPRAPVHAVHAECGHELDVELRCPACARAVGAEEVLARPGDRVERAPRPGDPGYLSARRLWLAEDGVPLAGPRRS
jgi:DNA-binding HxlR family transcriptional regulator